MQSARGRVPRAPVFSLLRFVRIPMPEQQRRVHHHQHGAGIVPQRAGDGVQDAYRGKHPVYHFDMYRITSVDDLFAVGFYDYLGSGILIIEWSENIESELEDDAIRIRISKSDDENERIFEIEGLDEYADIIG